MKLKLTNSGIIVAKAVSTIKAEAGEEEGVIDFTASTNSVDRDRDIVRQDGLILDFYKQNPVFLWAHNSWEPPIGQSIKSFMNEEGNFQIKVLFDLDDPFAHKIYRKYGKGFMKMVSIGFLPHELEEREADYGFVFTKTEIMEVSAVPVGSNREALAMERGTDASTSKSISFGQWLKENPGCIIKSTPVDTQIKSTDATEGPDAPAESDADKEPEQATEEPAQDAPEKSGDEPEQDAPEPSTTDDDTPEPEKVAVFRLFGSDEFNGYTVMTNATATQVVKALSEGEVLEGIERTRRSIDITQEGDETIKRRASGAVFMSLEKATDEQGGDPVSGVEDDDDIVPLRDSKYTINVDPDKLADSLAEKLFELQSNKSDSIILNVDGETFAGKDAEQVAKAIHDLIGSTADEAVEPVDDDSPPPVKMPDASEPTTATLTVVSGNQD